MASFQGTVGQLLIDEALPEGLRGRDRVLTKKGIGDLLHEVATKHPDDYVRVSKRLSDLGRRAATASGGYSYGPEHLRKGPAGRRHQEQMEAALQRLLDDDALSPEQRRQAIVLTAGDAAERQMKDVYDEAVAAKNPLALQVVSGARGNPMNLSSLIGSDMLYADHRDQVIPLPVTRSYSQGLTPDQYWAGTYGARKGVLSVKFSTQAAGFLCLAAGTRVRMADFTSRPIEAVQVDDWVLGADKDGRTFPVRVTATFQNGMRTLYRFRFRYGKSRTKTLSVTATKEHQALLRHIRRRRERPNPTLVRTTTISKAPLGDCERRSVSTHSLLPPQGFDDSGYGTPHPWAWFLGLLLGNGGLTTRHVGFSTGDAELLQEFAARAAEHAFDVRAKKGSACEYSIVDLAKEGGRSRLRTWLRELGLLGLKSPEKFIPDAVRRWDNASVAALLRGVFDTDGGVAWANNDSLPFLRLGMTARPVVHGVQRLLAQRFGIYGQVCRGNTIGRPVGIVPGSVANHDIHSFTIADRESVLRFAAMVNFASPTKRAALESRLAAMDRCDREDAFAFHYLDRELVGTGETYDIEVDHPDHLFVLANGAIVSNSKQLNQIAHRLVVTDEDGDAGDEDRGLPVETKDQDNEGALLSRAAGPYPRNTVLTPKILRHLDALGHDRILVRSPLVGGPPQGGVYARDAGIREYGTLPGRGEQVGLTAAQALSEPLSQSQLSAKHKGGVAGQDKGVTGFQAINQLVQTPKTFKGGAAHAAVDGRIDKVEDAPAGGRFVWIGGRKHYVARGFDLSVQPGDEVEAGDVISEGLPNPAEVVRHKGIGEGARYFTEVMGRAMAGAGVRAHRRNLELLARGLIDHVRLGDETEDAVPGDVVSYSSLERTYTPRAGAQDLDPRRALGKHLERPVLHYTIGTKVRPSVLRNLNRFGIAQVKVHDDPPPFEPEMIRGMASIGHDPDWMTRLYGSGQKGSLLDAVHHGGVSDEQGTSFVPGLARAVDFGRTGLVRQPQPGTPPEEPAVAKPPTLDVQALAPKYRWGPFKAAADEADAIRQAGDVIAAVAREHRIKLSSSLTPVVDRQPRPPAPRPRAADAVINYGGAGGVGPTKPTIDFGGGGGVTGGKPAGGARTSDVLSQLPPQSEPPLAAAMKAVNPQAYATLTQGGGAPAPFYTPPEPVAPPSPPPPPPAPTNNVVTAPAPATLGQSLASMPGRAAGAAATGAATWAADKATQPLRTAVADKARSLAGLAPRAATPPAPLPPIRPTLGGRLLRGAKGNLAWSAVGDVLANVPEAAHAAFGYGDDVLAAQQGRGRALAGQNVLERGLRGLTAPVSTIAEAAALAPEFVEAGSDLEQEAGRAAGLDRRTAARHDAQLAALEARRRRGGELTAGEQADREQWLREQQARTTPEPAVDYGAMGTF